MPLDFPPPRFEQMNNLHPDFVSPPPGFGEVAFYWWVGGKLDRERIRWQLDQLAGAKISGLQINYAHGTSGGISWGLTYPSDPPLFSEEWWELFAWFKGEANARGMAVSLSDYTLGIGQGWFCDGIIRDPALRGSVLEAVMLEPDSDMSATWTPDTLAAYAVKGGGESQGILPRRLRPFSGGVAALAEETVVLVRAVTRPHSLDPMNPEVGRRYIAGFFQQFEDRFPGECGRGLNYFFSDELDLGVAGHLWTGRFADEFLRRKGYDLMDELPALFMDIGARTPKVRLDYRDVMVALEEESFFRPIYEWHEARGMTYGCDHGWRGRKPTEFGDYFRTQRWNQGPGCDQPRLEADVVKNKVASSIAHLNHRPRTWLEGFYSSGWGTTSAQVADAVFRNFAMGHNLLTLHGLYYSTHGGWWEWAPPCNHFRMPYWPHLRRFLEASERLSYLLSQGRHACDVALHYPVAAVEAGAQGEAAVRAAFAMAEALYAREIDFDFVDFESLARAEARDGCLHMADESYRVLIIPPMPAIRFCVVEAAERLVEAGGEVIFLESLPAASERAGRGDPVLNEKLSKLMRGTAARCLPSVEIALAALSDGDRDFRVLSGGGAPFMQHRVMEEGELYFIYGLDDGALVELRAVGRVSRWDLWDGSAVPHPVESATTTHTRLRLAGGPSVPQLIWFEPGVPERAVEAESPREILISTDWTLEAVPCLDNRWGDFRLPAHPGFIGPEVRAVAVAPAAQATPPPDGVAWSLHAVGFGPMYRLFGPAQSDADARELRERLIRGDPSDGRLIDASWRYGIPDDAGFQGWHGLKGRVHDDLFVMPEDVGVCFLQTKVELPEALTAVWNLGGSALPSAVWVDGCPVVPSDPIPLSAGVHDLLLEYPAGGRGYAVLSASAIAPVSAEPAWFGPLHTRWFNDTRVFRHAAEFCQSPVWVRFRIPPGTLGFTIGLLGALEEVLWDGVPTQALAVEREPALFPEDGTLVWRVNTSMAADRELTVSMRLRPLSGCSGGQLVPDPIRLDVMPFRCKLGDWADIPGFECFSGGMRYTADFEAPPCSRLAIDLGALSASSEIWINGQSAGVRCAPPWTFDVGNLVRPGTNQLVVEARSALANHYKSIPTNYRGHEQCGLFGPVRLLVSP